MSVSYDYAVKYSTEKMVAKAYLEYCQDAEEAYTRLMAMASDAVTAPDSDSDSATVADQIISNYSQYGLSKDSIITLNEGCIRLGDWIQAISQNTIDTCQAIDSDSLSIPEDFNLPFLDYVNEDGVDQHLVKTVNINDMLSQMKSTHHALVVEEGVALAYDQAENVAERVALIRDTIASKFKSGYSDVSATLATAVAKVQGGVSAVTYVTDKIKSSGIDDIIAEKISTIGESDDVKYSGASPGGAFMSVVTNPLKVMFNPVNLVKATVQVAKATGKLLKSVGKIGSKLFKKAAKKLVQVVANPYDIKSINDAGNGTVDGYYYLDQIDATKSPLLCSKLDEGPRSGNCIGCHRH